ISPNGALLAEELGESKADIWITDIGRNVTSRFTFATEPRSAPAWSHDGKWISFSGSQQGHLNLYRKAANGTGQDELLLEGSNVPVVATDWTPDDDGLLYSVGDLAASG